METLAAIISPSVALITAVILWVLNEWGKRKSTLYTERMKLYEQLLRSIHGYYSGDDKKEKRQGFNDAFCAAWMFASKEVIEKADIFMETVCVGNPCSKEEREKAQNELVLAIRTDMKLSKPNVQFKAWISD